MTDIEIFNRLEEVLEWGSLTGSDAAAAEAIVRWTEPGPPFSPERRRRALEILNTNPAPLGKGEEKEWSRGGANTSPVHSLSS